MASVSDVYGKLTADKWLLKIKSAVLCSLLAWSGQDTCGLSHERVWLQEAQCEFCPGLHWGPNRSGFGQELIWYHHVRTPFCPFLFLFGFWMLCSFNCVEMWIFCPSSNCVVNLSPDKKRVLAEAYSLLKVHYFWLCRHYQIKNRNDEGWLIFTVQFDYLSLGWRWAVFQWCLQQWKTNRGN